MTHRSRVVALAGLGVGLFAAGAAFGQGEASPQTTKVYYDSLDEAGRLVGGVTFLTRGLPAAVIDPGSVGHEVILRNAAANRINMVLVGDGYTASDLGLYAQHAERCLESFFAKEPYRRYAPFFNITRVDVVSKDSGVDNDPTEGISRDTALGMGFWCGGIERLLCVDVGAAYAYARTAGDVDLVLAIGNSTKYGGAGYPGEDLATAAGGNDAAAEVAIHEFGHALGDLADEYDYGGGDTYTGGEPGEPNLTKLKEAAMASGKKKWWRWLGVSDPAFDGLVSTFEGAGYYQYGLFRPTDNSLMRSLGRPYNLPSVEAILLQVYTIVRPIDDATPTGETLDGTETLFVKTVDPDGAPLSVQWSLDGATIPGATGHELDLKAIGMKSGPHIIGVTVQDKTPWVRDEAARAAKMTEGRAWYAEVKKCRADCNGDGKLDVNDFVCMQSEWRKKTVYGDYDGSGKWDVNDFVAYQAGWRAGCE